MIGILAALAIQGNRTVICTIHQPSARIFRLFHKLCLLDSGRIVYHERTAGVVPYFAKLGHECPSFENVADWALELLQAEPGEP